MSTGKTKVLFVTGMGRSGSTILDNMLGQLEGFFSSGELMYLWDRGMQQNLLCGCGEKFRDCELWLRVMTRLPELDDHLAVRLCEIREHLTPLRAVALSELFSHSLVEDLEFYKEHLGRLYRAVVAETGCRVIVDSSKFPGHGLAISRLDDVDLYVLHMVRDSRAVAQAWRKDMIYDASGPETVYATILEPAVSSRQWTRWNLAVEMLWQDDPRYLRVRYIDFVAEPRATLERILEVMGLAGAKLPLVGDNEVDLQPSHAVAGNPSRFRLGRVALRYDGAWKEKQTARERRLVTALTWPLLQRYGYFD